MNDAADIRRALSDPRKLCEALGIAKGAGRHAKGLMIRCPWHKEKNPSCRVTKGDDGTVKVWCFRCEKGGDALHLVATVRGLDIDADFTRVLEEAAAIAGVRFERSEPKPETVSAPTYAALAAKLIELCPWTEEPDVYDYIDRRVLVVQGSAAGLAGMPRPSAQGPLVAKLLETFSVETLPLAGLVWNDRDTGRPDVDRFAWPDHRLLIPWRNLDGSIAVLQRRRIDSGERKYVFPPNMKPSLPFGAERLRAHAADRVIVFVEGAIDVLALRLLDSRDGLGILPLGLPGLGGWDPGWARFTKGRDVVIGFDADDAGEKKIEAVSADLYRAGATRVQRWTPKGAKDWAELVENGAPLPAKERAS